jgi:hypothetical protein
VGTIGGRSTTGTCSGAATAVALGVAPPAEARRRIQRAYRRETAKAGGTWWSLVTVAEPDGTHVPAVDDKADEAHTLLGKLAGGSMVSPAATRFMLGVMRWADGFHDGVRRNMSSDERLRTAIKYGAVSNGRHEVGVMFNGDGSPQLIFSFFADLPGHGANFGATNPLVEVRARLGRCMFDQVSALGASAASADRTG